MKEELTDRHRVIDIGVQLEYNISNFLKTILRIQNDDTRSFDRSSSLSFQQKLNLLLDLKILNKEEANKFELFAQIRNKFAHKLEVQTFADCFNSNQDLKNKMEKIYKTSSSFSHSLEVEMFIQLLTDIVLIGERLISKTIPNNAK